MIRAAFLAMALIAPPAHAATDVLSRPVAAGEAIDARDFIATDLPPAEARGTLTAEQADGMEARRPLPAGRPVRMADLAAPQVVRRNQPVTIVIAANGFTIRTAGRALANAAAGERVRVFADATNRTLDGTATGPATVTIAQP